VKGGIISVISDIECGLMIKEKLKSLAKRLVRRIVPFSNSRKNEEQEHKDFVSPNHVSTNEDETIFIEEDDPVLDCEIDEAGIQKLILSKQFVEFIDIREPYEYRQGYITDAVMIPMNEIPNVYQSFHKTNPKIVYCAAGIRSFDVCVYLRKKGITNIYSLEGGVATWAKHSYTYAEESQFFVGQLLCIVSKSKYIIQHIFKKKQQVYIRLRDYFNMSIAEEILEQDLISRLENTN
jgi:rhodanese-related sulfurtransferase